jgi:hypothetical protein
MEKKNFFQTAGGIAISLAVLFGTVWIISRAASTGWKGGQK